MDKMRALKRFSKNSPFVSEGSCCLGGATSFKDKEVLILIQRNLRFSSRLPDINSPTNLESEWKEKLQEQPTAPGTQGKAETGRMEMGDGFAAEPGLCQGSSPMP